MDVDTLLMDIWVDASIVEDYEEAQPDWVYGAMRDIEKLFGKDALELHKERFIKRDNAHLYAGAKVRSKRAVPYSELFNDPDDTYLDDEGSMALKADMHGEIVEDWVDPQEVDPEGYFDCVVKFQGHEFPMLCRVEWLDWEDDDDDGS